MAVRVYAQVLGVVLLLVGVVGLLAGDGLLFGILNIDVAEDIVHLITGGLLVYAGFGRPDIARGVVGALGVVYVLVGILGFVIPSMLGLIPSGYTVFDNLLHLVIGIVSLAIIFAPGGRTATQS